MSSLKVALALGHLGNPYHRYDDGCHRRTIVELIRCEVQNYIAQVTMEAHP